MLVLADITAPFRRFRADRSGNALPFFALSLLPLIGFMAAAVDYSRASSDQTRMQAALDAGVLAGAKDGTAQWMNVASNVFASSYQSRTGGSTPTPTFSVVGSRYSGSVSSKPAPR